VRRTDQLTHTERALTLALVLVAAGYAPRAVVLPWAAAHSSQQEATQSGEVRNASDTGEHRREKAEVLDRTPPAPLEGGPWTAAPAGTPYRSIFLAPPSQRGPPALG
jgi:hypothetical protein